MSFFRIEEVHTRSMDDRIFLHKKMELDDQRRSYVGSFISLDEFEAMYALYKEGNIYKAKNYFYEAALSIAYSYDNLGFYPFNVPKNIIYPLLSDSNSII